MKTSLNDNLLAYLKKSSGWHKKVALYVVADEFGYSPETAGRSLRELAENGEIAVEYYKGIRNQKLARYSYDKPPEKKQVVTIIGGVAHITYE